MPEGKKITGQFVEGVGDSDHLGVRALNYCRTQAIKKCSYKGFVVEHFMADIYCSYINDSVRSHDTIDVAAEAFRSEFSEILNYMPQ